jgi:Bacterial transglutaminase-like N-terminal region
VSAATATDLRRYRLVHRTEYTYDDVVTSSFGLTHLLPRETKYQRPLVAGL